MPPGHTLNPNAVLPPPGSSQPNHLAQPSKKIANLTSSVDKQRELLIKLQQDKIRTEMELKQNAMMMEDKL